jgi:hypothetical protein
LDLFGGLRREFHSADPLGWREPQLLDEQREIDAMFPGCLNAAALAGVPQSEFGPREFFRRQGAQFAHAFILPSEHSQEWLCHIRRPAGTC